MTINEGLRMTAGIVVTASVALSQVHSPWWLILTFFAGLNLLQSAFTGWCPMVWILGKAGLQKEIPAPPEGAANEESPVI